MRGAPRCWHELDDQQARTAVVASRAGNGAAQARRSRPAGHPSRRAPPLTCRVAATPATPAPSQPRSSPACCGQAPLRDASDVIGDPFRRPLHECAEEAKSLAQIRPALRTSTRTPRGSAPVGSAVFHSRMTSSSGAEVQHDGWIP